MQSQEKHVKDESKLQKSGTTLGTNQLKIQEIHPKLAAWQAPTSPPNPHANEQPCLRHRTKAERISDCCCSTPPNKAWPAGGFGADGGWSWVGRVPCRLGKKIQPGMRFLHSKPKNASGLKQHLERFHAPCQRFVPLAVA